VGDGLRFETDSLWGVGDGVASHTGVGARSAGDGLRFETDDLREIGDGVASHTVVAFKTGNTDLVD
jgi:hypothetical protein